MSVAESIDPPQLVPRLAVRRDRKLPLIIAASLLLHAAILLPLLLPKETAPPTPQEIPVELVREPPPPAKLPSAKPPAAKPPAAKPPEPKPPEQKAAEQKKPEPAKPPARKPSETSAAEKKQEATEQRMHDLLGDNTSIDPAIALPGASTEGTEDVSYRHLVLSQVAKAKKEGRYQGVPGKAFVAFTLTDTGAVASVELKTPSGDPTLDEEAIAMVKRGAPYPAPPPGASRDFVIGLQFRALP